VVRNNDISVTQDTFKAVMIYHQLFMTEETLLLEHPSWNQNYLDCGFVTQDTMPRQLDQRCPLGRVGSQPLDRNHVPLALTQQSAPYGDRLYSAESVLMVYVQKLLVA
jgi:hypothetical protein